MFPATLTRVTKAERHPGWTPLPEEVAQMSAELIACAEDPTRRPSEQCLHVASIVLDAADTYAPQWKGPTDGTR
jgi:hypothetical protein